MDLRLDEQQAEAVIRLHGEVQKEVLAAPMQDRYGVPVRFSGTLTACIERVAGTGAAEDRVHERGNPYLAGLGLRIEAARSGTASSSTPGSSPAGCRRHSSSPRRKACGPDSGRAGTAGRSPTARSP